MLWQIAGKHQKGIWRLPSKLAYGPGNSSRVARAQMAWWPLRSQFMKTIAVKFLAVFSLAAMLGGVALTAGCPSEGEGEGEGE